MPALAAFAKSGPAHLPIPWELSTLKIDHCDILRKTTHCGEFVPDLSVLLKWLWVLAEPWITPLCSVLRAFICVASFDPLSNSERYWVYLPTKRILSIPSYRECTEYIYLPSVYWACLPTYLPSMYWGSLSLHIRNPQFWNQVAQTSKVIKPDYDQGHLTPGPWGLTMTKRVLPSTSWVLSSFL